MRSDAVARHSTRRNPAAAMKPTRTISVSVVARSRMNGAENSSTVPATRMVQAGSVSVTTVATRVESASR